MPFGYVPEPIQINLAQLLAKSKVKGKGKKGGKTVGGASNNGGGADSSSSSAGKGLAVATTAADNGQVAGVTAAGSSGNRIAAAANQDPVARASVAANGRGRGSDAGRVYRNGNGAAAGYGVNRYGNGAGTGCGLNGNAAPAGRGNRNGNGAPAGRGTRNGNGAAAGRGKRNGYSTDRRDYVSGPSAAGRMNGTAAAASAADKVNGSATVGRMHGAVAATPSAAGKVTGAGSTTCIVSAGVDGAAAAAAAASKPGEIASAAAQGAPGYWKGKIESTALTSYQSRPPKINAMYVRTASMGEMKKLMDVSDNEALLTLLDPTCGLFKLFELANLPEESMELLVSVILKICRAEDARHAIRMFLTSLCDVRFLDLHLVDHVNRVSVSRASSVIELCHVLIRTVPSCSHKHTAALLGALRRSAKKMQLDHQPGSLLDKLKDVEEEFEEVKRARSQGEVMRDEENEGEGDVIPPDDFRKIPTIPTLPEIICEEPPFLRKNIIYGAYKSAEHYLDVQYRLLREDFVGPLRQGIRKFQAAANRKHPGRPQTDVRLYSKVKVLMPYCTQKGIMYKAQFDVTPLKKVKWETSKRLIPGSLVGLSKDGFHHFTFGTVAEGLPEELAEGVVHLIFDEASSLTLDPNPFTEYEMLESSTYFEAYRHVLEGLQEMSETDLPFQKYLLNQHISEVNEVQPPMYLRGRRNVTYNFAPTVGEDVMANQGEVIDEELLAEALEKWTKVPLLDDTAWPTAEDLHLDLSQYSALKTALTKEFSVIQGPPGTGKTFVGLKIADMLLNNRPVWSADSDATSPILVVCYTNHALDQFLGGILDLCNLEPGELIRIGGQVSSESANGRLQQCTVRELQKNREMDAKTKRLRPLLHQVKNSMSFIESQITALSAEMSCAHTNVIHEQYLHRYMTTAQSQSLFNAPAPWTLSALPQWLQLVPKPVSSKTSGSKDTNGKDGRQPVARTERTRHNMEGGVEIAAQRMEHLNQISEMSKNLSKIMGVSDGITGWAPAEKAASDKSNKEPEEEGLMSKEEALLVEDVWRLSLVNRWRLYRHWLSMFCQERAEATRSHNEQFNQLAGYLSELTREQDYAMLQQAFVIGMTTTGAAKYRRLIRRVQPKIVIVEEAAEVLESHIVTTLSSRCEQLILIGDHQQLRPNPTVYKLAKEFHLDISLFERMVKNNIHCEKLRIQHRMRPEVAALIVPHIYKDLTNHESVLNYPDILGVGGNVFFINHSVSEQKKDDDSRSRSNLHEAEYIAALVKYLLQQGYDEKQITVLAAYSGQAFMIRRSLPPDEWKGVRITTIDAYQGEENDIVILSLVRSNEEGNIGFLQTHNRVCVALSRARWGLFVIGDMKLLAEASPMWKNIVKHLKSKGQIVDALPLFCRNHPEHKILAHVSENFDKAPEGGCMIDCGFDLACGHKCEKKCHPVDSGHQKHMCMELCKMPLCDLGHKCDRLCHEDCPDCTVLVEKVMPDCGHKQMVPCCVPVEEFMCEAPCELILECGHACQESCGSAECTYNCKVVVEDREWPCKHVLSAACHLNPDNYPCPNKVTKVLPCGHSAEMNCSTDEKEFLCNEVINAQLCDNEAHVTEMRCHEKESDAKCKHSLQKTCPLDATHVFTVKCHENDSAVCPLNCKVALECGHSCTGKCGSCSSEQSHPPCQRSCEKILPCGHQCRGKCGSTCPPCIERCNLYCGHQQCDLKCHAECKKCELACKWSCEHEKCELKCSEPCVRAPCSKPCKRPLLCSKDHLCIGLCGEICPRLCRICHENELLEIVQHSAGEVFTKSTRFICLQPCGHTIDVESMDAWVKATEPAPPCEIQPLKCPFCSKMVGHCPRYNNRIKSYMQQINETKESVKSSDRVNHNLSCAVTSIWNNSPPAYIREVLKKTEGLTADCVWRGFSFNCLCLYQECSNLSALCLRKKAQVSDLVDRLKEYREEFCKSIEEKMVHKLAPMTLKLGQLFLYFHVRRLLAFIKNPRRIDDLLDMEADLNLDEKIDLWDMRDIAGRMSSRFSLQQRDGIDDYFEYLYDYLVVMLVREDTTTVARLCSKGHAFSCLAYKLKSSLSAEDLEKLCDKCHPLKYNPDARMGIE